MTKADEESRRRLFNHFFHDLFDSSFLAPYNEVYRAGCTPRAERQRGVAGGSQVTLHHALPPLLIRFRRRRHSPAPSQFKMAKQRK